MQNFMQIPLRVKYTQKFLYPYTFFFTDSTTGQTLWSIFARDGSNDAVSRKDVPLGG